MARARVASLFRTVMPMLTSGWLVFSMGLVSTRGCIEIAQSLGDPGPIEGKGVVPGPRGGQVISLTVIEEVPDLLGQVAMISGREPGAAFDRDRLPQPAVVARHHGLAARLRLDRGHAEHLEFPGRHHEDVREVIEPGDPLLGDGPEIEAAGVADPVLPFAIVPPHPTELADRPGDDQPDIIAPAPEGSIGVDE